MIDNNGRGARLMGGGGGREKGVGRRFRRGLWRLMVGKEESLCHSDIVESRSKWGIGGKRSKKDRDTPTW